MSVQTAIPGAAPGASVDPEDVARFSSMAAEWWDPNGSFRPLHKFNPVRLACLRDRLCRHFKRDVDKLRPLTGLRILDLGCGGGLVSEPMTRLGATVVAVDASAENIGVGRAHAELSGLDIDYRQTTAEDLAAAGESFDAVLALEIVEHVADLDVFMSAVASLVRSDGALLVATLNRTPQAYLLAVVGAEYVLRWLPRGTHDWRKFLRPSELAAALRRQNMSVRDLTGMSYSPIADAWRATGDLAVNYMAYAVKD